MGHWSRPRSQTRYSPRTAGGPRSFEGVTQDRPYEELLEKLGEARPRVAGVLSSAHRSRVNHLGAYVDGVRLGGVEELLNHLDGLTGALADVQDQLAVRLLLERSRADFELAVDALLGGFAAPAFDAMRDVMEIELLLLDFSVTPGNAARWLKATNDERWNVFRPRAILKRLAAWGVISFDQARTVDYAGHSASLHPAPPQNPFVAKNPSGQNEPFGIDAGFWDFFEHARRLLHAFERLPVAEQLGPPSATNDKLAVFRDAWERTQQMQAMAVAILTAAQELSRRPDESDEGAEAAGEVR